MHTPSQTMERPETTYGCPLCEHRSDTTTDVYVHLQISHRKSEISEALIEATTGERTRSEFAER